MSSSTKMTTNQQNQSGMVSIMVTMVMMILVTLIVLSFSQIIRREQRQTLDRQLSTQAFYAAESGVNIAVNELLHNVPQAVTANDLDTSCATTSNLNTPLDAAGDVKVSCIRIDTTVPNLEYGTVDSHAQVAPLNAVAAISSLKIQWQETGVPAGSSATCTQSPGLRTIAPDWTCPVGLLRIDLVPTSGALDRTVMQNSQFTAFLYPSSLGASNTTYASGSGANQGAIISTQCSVVPVCTMTITGLAGTSYTAKIHSYYQKSRVTLTALDAINNTVNLSGAQAIIDATGKAQDVLRRIQVRIPLASATIQAPDAALQAAEGLCKRYLVNPNTSITLDAGTITDPTGVCLSDTVGGVANSVPPGDGYAPVLVSGKIYNMFHHRVGLYIVCNDLNLNPCNYDTDATPTPTYITPQHSKMILVGSNLYYPAQKIAGGLNRDFGIGCFNPTTHLFCGFATLGTTSFVNVGPLPSATDDFSAGIDNIALVNGKLYTMGIDTSGNTHIYCADPGGGAVPVPCPGFSPYDVGVNVGNNTIGQYDVGLNVSGTRILFNTNSFNGVFVGCFETNAGGSSCWPSKTVNSGIDNITSVLVAGELCLTDYGSSANFTTKCFNAGNGTVIPSPPNYLPTGSPKPVQAQAAGAFWANWDPLYDGTKIYLTGVTRQNPGEGAIYCYDTSIANTCPGWGVNGWADGIAQGNNFSTYEPYAVIHVGNCLIGVGDEPQTPAIFKLSPVNAGPVGSC